jgi:hypothetical protein
MHMYMVITLFHFCIRSTYLVPCKCTAHLSNPCSITHENISLVQCWCHSTSLKRSQLPGPRSWGTLEKEEKGFFCGRDKGVFRSTYVEEQPKVLKRILGMSRVSCKTSRISSVSRKTLKEFEKNNKCITTR